MYKNICTCTNSMEGARCGVHPTPEGVHAELKQIDTPAGKLTKTCLFCRHFYFTGGSPGYSEQTPGGDVGIGCNLNLWETKLYDEASELRRYMLTAQFCSLFISHVG